MKIYKFKDLRQEETHSHFFQIIEENKVWCAAPHTLNDSSEFNFSMDYTPSGKTAVLLTSMIQKFGTLNFPAFMTASYAILHNKIEEYTKSEVDKIINKCRESIGVTSFSLSRTDPWLWKTYGGLGFGAAVEFDIPDSYLGDIYHLVDYLEVNVFHVDIFLESVLGDTEKIFRKMLCTKTLNWKPEMEIRFLGKTPNVNITFDAPVTGVVIGEKVSEPLIKRIKQSCTERNIKVHDRQ